jgi:hypothetical protein
MSYNEEIRFVPNEEEMTPDLKQLMLSISAQIDEYCIKTSASPSLINRFVAGHVCCEDLDHLAVNFKKPKQVPLDLHQVGISLILSKVGNLAVISNSVAPQNYQKNGPI